MRAQRLIWILWPSFIVAAAATGVFFTLFDPGELRLFGREPGWSRLAVYSVGFFAFWAFGAASSGLTCFFQRGAAEINRRPPPPAARAEGCSKPDEPSATRP
ncbi:MAG: hypothetical protein M5U08_10400 [Burkholderiales bacterium]|nr:hypothetical protein [Burkholderiales bacterium]